MRSMQIVEWGKPLEMREAVTPQPIGKEVLLRVDACGVCHSDLHIWDGFFDLGNGQKFPIEDRGVALPFTMGHEPVGTVVATGLQGDAGLVGKSFAVYPWINCGECQSCRNGLTQICDAPRIIGTRVDGAYSDHLVVPDADFLVDHAGIAPELACTLACSGLTAYSAIKKIQPDLLTEQDTVVVIGAGGLGLTAIRILKALCTARIVASDINPESRAAAQELGADYTADPTDERAAPYILKQANTRRGVAATLDFVGLPQTMGFALSLLRKGGQHIHVGLFGGAHPVSLPPLAFRMLRIAGSYVGTLDEFRELVALAQSGVDLSIPVTTRPLEAAAETLAELKNGKIVGRMILLP